ncbi:hypothetical protein BD779DRAFT_1471016 [Infundibulicybe gibba]|nr:hypothetical protein BD779DRAFT_1471016 [Infundibulicybe gibba]
MPFFAGASQFTINGSEMNDVAGDLNKNEVTNITTNENSHNKRSYTTKGSYGHSSKDKYRNCAYPPASTYSPNEYYGNAGHTICIAALVQTHTALAAPADLSDYQMGECYVPATRQSPGPQPTATPKPRRNNNPFQQS